MNNKDNGISVIHNVNVPSFNKKQIEQNQIEQNQIESYMVSGKLKMIIICIKYISIISNQKSRVTFHSFQ